MSWDQSHHLYKEHNKCFLLTIWCLYTKANFFFFFPQCSACLFRSPSLIRQNLRYKEFFHFFYAHLSTQHVPTLTDLLTFWSLKMLWWGDECVSTSSERIWVYYHILEILLALECSTPCVPLAAAHVRGTVPFWDFLCPTFACKYVGFTMTLYKIRVEIFMLKKCLLTWYPRRKGQKEVQGEGPPFLSKTYSVKGENYAQ